MSIRDKNGRWRYRFQIDGRRIEQSTGLAATERNRPKAERMEAAHYQAVLEGRWGIRRLEVRNFTEAAEEFLEDLRVNRGAESSTFMRIRTSMASLITYFGTQTVSLIQPGDIDRYRTWRLSGEPPQLAPVKPVTVKHDLDNLSLLFQWSVRRNYCRENVTRDVKRPSDKDAIRMNIVSEAAERIYFRHATGNLHDVARLILLQGMRPAEVMALRKEDVDFTVNAVIVRKGKTSAARRVLRLTSESRAILGRRLSSPGPWIFPSDKKPGEHISKLNCPHDRVIAKTLLCSCGKNLLEHPVKNGCANFRQVGGLDFVLYDLRHTFATRMIAAGVDVMTLKEIMGHRDIRVTQKYVHPSQARQNEAMAMYERKLLEADAKQRLC